jgi:hypothetical protein
MMPGCPAKAAKTPMEATFETFAPSKERILARESFIQRQWLITLVKRFTKFGLLAEH